jgi:transcriptional regulator with XRE-family HTH domain
MRYGKQGSSLYPEIGERIMVLRRRADLTQRQLGALLGVSHVAVGDIERGSTKPDLDNLAAIADALGVPLSEIVVLERRAER